MDTSLARLKTDIIASNELSLSFVTLKVSVGLVSTLAVLVLSFTSIFVIIPLKIG
jgi:hypothetical protein